MADYFLDTSILLYAVSTNPAEADRSYAARVLIQRSYWAWSAQVASEFIRASTSPRLISPLTRAEAKRWVGIWMTYPMAAVDAALVLEALQIAERFQTTYLDAQILAAAKSTGCPVVYSEVLIHGHDYGGIRALNPFLTSP